MKLSLPCGRRVSRSSTARRSRNNRPEGSRTRRLITNVRLLAAEGGEARATANFAVWRFQHEATDVYVGQYRHVLVRGPSGLLFRERRAVLDLETLRPHGKLSFII